MTSINAEKLFFNVNIRKQTSGCLGRKGVRVGNSMKKGSPRVTRKLGGDRNIHYLDHG